MLKYKARTDREPHIRAFEPNDASLKKHSIIRAAKGYVQKQCHES